MLAICAFAFLVYFGHAESAYQSGVGRDVFEDLMNVMMKIKCKADTSVYYYDFKLIEATYRPVVVLDNKEVTRKPAFFATLSASINLGAKKVVKFDAVKTNIGKGYDPSTGVFTAPQSGIYEFSVNFLKLNVNDWLYLQLIKNNGLIANGYSSNAGNSAGSINAIIELKQADRVFVHVGSSTAKLNGTHFSMFSGHLL